LFFFGGLDYLLRLIEKPLSLGKGFIAHLTRYRITAVVFSMLVALVCLKIVKMADARFLLTPTLSGYYNIMKYADEEEKYLIEFDSNYPERTWNVAENTERRGNFNVLLIMHESLHADHMSLYGYERDTTPYQKEYFKNSYLFPEAVSSSTSTRATNEAIFTGLDRSYPRKLLKSTSLLWHYMHESDIRTFYVTSHWLRWRDMGKNFIDPEAIDLIKESFVPDSSMGRPDMETARIFAQEIGLFASGEEPFFGVLHFSTSHFPYFVSEEHWKWQPVSLKWLNPYDPQPSINQYDNSILYTDRAVEVALKKLRELGLDQNTVIIMSADHGEAFYQHKQFIHTKVYWQEGIHVPFVVHIPDSLKQYFSSEELSNLDTNRDSFVSTSDIFPTVLDIFNVPAGKRLTGRSLLKEYAEHFNYVIWDFENQFAAINSHSGKKYYVDNERKRIRYTDIRNDPDEREPKYIEFEDPLVKASFERLAASLRQAENASAVPGEEKE
jgi:glucan phosphoethanolaminetransferase (alkaline phosphatase superfamily)